MAKIRVVLNGVHFYTTATAIRNLRVGDNSMQNTALRFCLDAMGKSLGIGRSVHLYDSKMTKHTYDVQLSRV